MGNAFCVPKCEPVVQGSIINLSDDCVCRILHENEPRISKLKKNFPLEEERYFRKLKHMDEQHGKIYGVSFEGFKKIADQLEKKIISNKTVPCAKHRLLKCLHDHEYCMIKCRQELDRFVDCIDAFRVQVIKEKIKKEAEHETTGSSPCPKQKKKV